ncbi:MAG: hypothetical protein GVY31_02410 [Alphaproteobacteria bacterium]|jgi:long-subunit fatty acid transport protein|nr:hypothetical protein [Alphaproteobacteria bacterium]
MKKVLGAGAALLLTTGLAHAGGLDRSGLSISPLFEEGDYAELSFGLVNPTVSGTVSGGTASSGNMADSYVSLGAAYKTDINDRIAVALIWEEGFGAAVDYTNSDAGYLVPQFTAELSGTVLSAIAKYQVNDRFSVHGGLRYVTMSGTVDPAAVPGNPVEYEKSSDLGYAIGASYEIPDIALRATLTYNSATTHNNTINDPLAPAQAGGATETGEYKLPQSVNLDFQTGIAQDTLLLASVRWAEWTTTSINTNTVGTIDYDNDVYTYTLGVARRFSDTWSGVARVSYEKANGGLASNLAPTDGSIGITLAGIYTMDNMTITAGVNISRLGDAETESPGGPLPEPYSEFSGNSAVGVGVSVGYNF